MRIFEIKSAATNIPKYLFHGTNLISAAAIIRDGVIMAEDPVDDADLGAVVCTSSSKKVARMFAVEFARPNSRLDVGAVFILDGRKIEQYGDIIPHTAETQGSVDEKEYRVTCDISKDCILSVTLVGKTSYLRSERWLERLYDDDSAIPYTFGTYLNFYNSVRDLISKSRS